MGETTEQSKKGGQGEEPLTFELPIERGQILEILPHRPPMLLVDRITELDPGKSVRGTRTLRDDDPWFAGHFPGKPIMPGVLMIEAIAQTGAILLLSRPEFRNKLALFAGADKVRAKRVIVPGEVMDIRCELDYFKMGVGRAPGSIYVNDELAMTAQIRFKIVDEEI